jgi:hypothetical protein
MKNAARPKPQFAEKHREISEAAGALQLALRDAIGEILPAEFSSRSLARGLGLDKSLGWQAHRIALSADPAAVLSALPGERGVSLLLEALANRGASEASVARVRAAAGALRAIVKRSGASTRELRAIAAGGLDSDAQRKHLARAQKSQFESSVAIRGESVETQVGTYLVVPSKRDPSLITLVALYFVAGHKTVRPLGPRIVYRGVTSYPDHAAWERQKSNEFDLERFPALVPAASSPRLDRAGLEVKKTQNGWFVLADPDQHPAKSLTLGFCETIEEIGSVHRTEGDRFGELAMQVSSPLRDAYVDVLFDKSLPTVEPSPAMYFAAINGLEHGEYRELRRFSGEFHGGFVDSPRVSMHSRPDAARYAKLLAHGASLVGRKPGDFRCYRAHMLHPPMLTRAVVRWLLPERTGQAAR